ncbi:MAG: HAD family hydrolase [Defluviitaleaceae bacterium]|nr:HAD family hydrolase [Defluviitaleaceae bacterium]MCL2836344.1 HAD family hydrolase [Defluviitaleaceae bacterium]
MNIKMIVTDLDGTLLRDDKTVSERTAAALKRCRESGIKIAYATARGHSAAAVVPPVFDGCARMNGAAAYAGERLIYSRRMPPAQYGALLAAAHNAGIEIAAEASGGYYANFDPNVKWPGYSIAYAQTDFNTFDVEAEKVYALIDSPQTLEFIKKHLPDVLNLYVSRDDFAFFSHREATKADAVAALAGYWRIEREDIAAFGDDSNDLGLLAYCGFGVAMGNALDEVKAAADFICDTNENDGIAKWLEEKIIRLQ